MAWTGVSVVIPCYNAAQYLRDALDSVFAQEYEGPLEVLVGDDGSTDGSREIAESWGAPVRVLQKPLSAPQGAAAARNRCILAAVQPLVAFLDADDLWLPGHLATLAKFMYTHPQLGLVYDQAFFGAKDGKRIIAPHAPPPRRHLLTPDSLLLRCIFPGSVMVRRCVFESVGYFDETLKQSEDHDMWLRIVEAFEARFVPHDGSFYRMNSTQTTRNACELWSTASVVLDRASQRHPYSRRALRKRRAVIAYRFGQLAWYRRQFLQCAWMLTKAALFDPIRATWELFCAVGRFVSAFPRSRMACPSYRQMPSYCDRAWLLCLRLHGHIRRQSQRLIGWRLPGTSTLLRRLNGRFVFQSQGRRFAFEPDLSKAYGALLGGRWNEEETHIFLRSVFGELRQETAFVDVGGCIGEMAIDAAGYSMVKEVVMFEPCRASAGVVTASASLNGFDHVRIIPRAVLDRRGHVPFVSNRDDPPVSHVAGDHEVEATWVPATTLDAELTHMKKSVVLLIDTEGNELRVLKGGRSFVARCNPLIIFEYNELGRRHYSLDDVRSLLGGNYEIFRLRADGWLDTDFRDTWNCVAVPRSAPFYPVIEELIRR